MIPKILHTKPIQLNLPKIDFFGPATTKKKSGSSKKKSSSSKRSSPAAPQYTDEELISKYIASMYAGYTPSHITYEETPAAELSSGIASWLRPSYDKAIAERKELTENYHAELDADAISRGMGASTYVSSVKSRQRDAEARDIASYETDYAAQLAKQLTEAVSKEKDRAFEVKVTNAQRDHDAYMTAYNAALTMFQAYKAGNPGNVVTKLSGVRGLKTLEDCESYVSGLSASQRAALFDGADAGSLIARNEMITNIGATNFLYLQQQYPKE